MKAAVVRARGQSPAYLDFPAPSPHPGESLLRIATSALSRTTKSRASGAHYGSPSDFPFVAGVDGVGRREDGTRVYFVFPRPPYGSLAEQTVVDANRCLPVPSRLTDVQAAALANPGISSWAACEERARLSRGETVLVNGATGVAGRLAVQVAKYLGAGKVVATGRSLEALRTVKPLGADTVLPLDLEAESFEKNLAAEFGQGVDVVLDYLWGPSAERLLVAAARHGPEGRPLRYVSIGSVAGGTITLPSAVLRSSGISLLGSGTGSVSIARLVSMLGRLLQAAADQHWEVAAQSVPLSEIGAVWSKDDGGPRVVLTIGR